MVVNIWQFGKGKFGPLQGLLESGICSVIWYENWLENLYKNHSNGPCICKVQKPAKLE